MQPRNQFQIRPQPPREVTHEAIRFHRPRGPEPARVGVAELAHHSGDCSGSCIVGGNAVAGSGLAAYDRATAEIVRAV